MVIASNKKALMSLYSEADDLHSHRVRIVLAEKGVNFELIETTPKQLPEEILSVNPYRIVPTLSDRNLIIYQSNIIMEYLDERFPHPPLLPVYPVLRAKARLILFRIEQDWYPCVYDILANTKTSEKSRQKLVDMLNEMAPVFGESPFFLSDEFSLVDCTILPVLWRLPQLGISDKDIKGKALHGYCERHFKRSSFKSSLTETEYEIRLKEHEL